MRAYLLLYACSVGVTFAVYVHVVLSLCVQVTGVPCAVSVQLYLLQCLICYVCVCMSVVLCIYLCCNNTLIWRCLYMSCLRVCTCYCMCICCGVNVLYITITSPLAKRSQGTLYLWWVDALCYMPQPPDGTNYFRRFWRA